MLHSTQNDSDISIEVAEKRIATWQGAYQEWLDKGDQKHAEFWLKMAESEKCRLEMIKEYNALQWCQERRAKIDRTESSIIVNIPGFDTIIADTIEQAVQLAIELEESLKQPAEQTIPNPSWLPSAAELDAAECELAIRQLEEGNAAYAEMAEDETRAIKAELTNGAYFL